MSYYLKIKIINQGAKVRIKCCKRRKWMLNYNQIWNYRVQISIFKDGSFEIKSYPPTKHNLGVSHVGQEMRIRNNSP